METPGMKKVWMPIILLALLAGCVRSEKIALDWREKIRFSHQDSYFKNNVQIGRVVGDANGRIIPVNAFSQEQFKTALTNAFDSVDLLSEVTPARFILETEIIDVYRPYAGLDRVSEVNVRYTIIDTQLRDIIYDNKISSTFYMKIEDNYSPFTWGRTGIEKAASKNIRLLMEDLYLFDNASLQDDSVSNAQSQ